MPTNLKWGSKKIELFKKLYPHYSAGELTRADMTKIFKCHDVTINRYAQRLNLQHAEDESIDLKYLKKIGFDIEI